MSAIEAGGLPGRPSPPLLTFDRNPASIPFKGGGSRLVSRQTLFNQFWATPLGRCFVHNLLDSVDLRTLARSSASLVLDDLALQIGRSGGDALDEVAAVIDHRHAFLSSPIKPRPLPDFIATSFNASYVTSSLRISPDAGLRDLATAIQRFYRIAVSGSKARLRDQERRVHSLLQSLSGGHPDGLIELDLTGNLLGPKGFGWFTSYDEGDEETACWPARSGWAVRGDSTRDVLGLIHYGSDMQSPPAWDPMLIATYVVPRSALGAHPVFARPNGFDGVGGTRFRARYGRADQPAAPWGRTVNLSKLDGPRPYRGGREIVLQNLVPTAPIRFTVAGAIWVPRDDFYGVGDDRFEKIVAGKRGRPSRERRFLRL